MILALYPIISCVKLTLGQITDRKFNLPGGLTNGEGSLPIAITTRIGQSNVRLCQTLQIIGFGIHKLKYCGRRRKYWFPAILYNSILTLKAFLGSLKFLKDCIVNVLNIICFFSLWKNNNLFLYECPISSITLVPSLSPCEDKLAKSLPLS